MNFKFFNTKLFISICLIGIAFISMSFIKNNTTPVSDGEFVVVLDAGHGGHDPGNLGNGYLEKNIALNIVLQIGSILEKTPGVKVVYTRDDDTFVNLYVRGEIANKANADLFVSVHCDSHSSDAHGAGTFVLGLHANKQNFDIAKKENSVIYLEDNYESRYSEYDINSPESVIGLTIMQEEFLEQSVRLAKLMQDNFTGKLKRTNRKVKQAGFIVLHQTFMPSVLVETGFLTNKDEGAYLNSKKGQTEMGSEIAKAIINFKGGLIDNTTVTSIPSAPDPQIVKEEVVKKEKPKAEPIIEKVIPEKEEETEVVKEKIEDDKSTVINIKRPSEEKIIAVKETSKKISPVKETKISDNIIFKVQIVAGSRDIPLNPENFKGLNKLSKEPYNGLIRYMYGSTNSYQQAILFKSNADAKGYTTSYIVAYKDGARIKLSDALQGM